LVRNKGENGKGAAASLCRQRRLEKSWKRSFRDRGSTGAIYLSEAGTVSLPEGNVKKKR